MKIVLIGFACCYKSSVGRLLSSKLNYKHIDTDVRIAETVGKSVSDIFAEYSESGFRKIENKTLSDIAKLDNVVVSCGGGSVLCEYFSRLAANSVVIRLTASAQTVLSRLGNESRPLFDGKSSADITGIMDWREPYYANYADYTIDTDGKTSEQVACELIRMLKLY